MSQVHTAGLNTIGAIDQWMKTISANVTGSTVSGFRGERVEFGEVLEMMTRSGAKPTDGYGSVNPIQSADSGVMIKGTETDFSQGSIQQTGEDQMDAAQVMKMKRINEDLVNKTLDLESSAEYKDAVEVLKKTEQDVIPKVENAEDRRELEDLCRQVRLAMGSGNKQKMEEASATLNDRLLNYAYLL